MPERAPIEGLKLSWLDRFFMSFAPKWALERVKARASAQLMARHFEAAQGTRRTANWYRTISDANAANGMALAPLRELARDLRRNNDWAKNGVRAIVADTVGWGILAKPQNRSQQRSDLALKLWNAWATSTACDYDGRLDFYGLQRLAMECIVESGEVLIIKQPANSSDGLTIPMRLHVVEPDYIDTNRNGIVGELGGPIIDGVEFDKFGRRVAYWLYTVHPGSQRLWTQKFQSVRVPADRVLHIYRVDRPGQIRGVPWLASAITRLKDFDDFEDAELMQQKVAACFGAFVTDIDGTAPALGVTQPDTDGNELESLEPGHIAYLKPGQTVSFAQPTQPSNPQFSERSLRRIAAGIGTTYERLTGDYSQVNFSSARMSRIAAWGNIREWRHHMLIPLMCNGVWAWAMRDCADTFGWPDPLPTAKWVAPPMPILEPDKEGLAYQRLIRNGLITLGQAIAERGGDPTEHLKEIAEYNEALDKAGIVLDCDPRQVNQVGQKQLSSAPGAGAGPASDGGEDDGSVVVDVDDVDDDEGVDTGADG